jgi:hypothetical protein
MQLKRSLRAVIEIVSDREKHCTLRVDVYRTDAMADQQEEFCATGAVPYPVILGRLIRVMTDGVPLDLGKRRFI